MILAGATLPAWKFMLPKSTEELEWQQNSTIMLNLIIRMSAGHIRATRQMRSHFGLLASEAGRVLYSCGFFVFFQRILLKSMGTIYYN